MLSSEFYVGSWDKMWGTVGIARGRVRHLFALGTVLAGMLLAGRPCAFALDPSLDVSQYAHTAWKVRDGFFKGTIISIAQTPDGYLWLGTEFGLLRFDGVRAIPWEPSPDQHLPSNQIWSLLAAHDGTLWIGTSKGLVSWKDGKLTQYPELAGHGTVRLLEDREGTVWAGFAYILPGRLCAIQKGNVQCYGKDSLGEGVFGLYEDSKGNLWVGVKTGLWRWKPGPPKFYPLPGNAYDIRALAEDDEGALLVGWKGGIYRFVDGKTQVFPLPSTMRQFTAERLLRDHDGGLWIGTSEWGLAHVHKGRRDVFAQSDGLSGDHVVSFFEDREGSIWAATLSGLDRFRDFAAATFSTNQGLSNALPSSVLAARDGSVWLGTALGGLDRWSNGEIKAYDKRSPPVLPSPHGENPANTDSDKQEGKLNGLPPNSLFQDRGGRIWVSTPREFGYLQNNRFVSIKGMPGGAVYSVAQDSEGNLWVAHDLGLFQLLRNRVVQQIPWSELGHADRATALAADPLHGGLWLGFLQGGVAYFDDGQVRESYAAANGLSEGRVAGLQFDQGGTLWAATEGGLSRLKNGRIATLTAKNGLPCDVVHGVMEDDDHSLWLHMACGLVRIQRSELDAWAAVVDSHRDVKRKIQATVFDSSDGVRYRSLFVLYSPQVARSTDGKLWFISLDGFSVLDPRHLPFNKRPPPVYIEQITADHKVYDVSSDTNGQVRLPPRIRDLQIDYTALSLVAPEKVLFRYKLEGWDRDWQDAGTRRQAFYSNLPPRNYRFRVMACNNSGVWNEAGASLDFSVAPAYYQTWWFRSLCVAAFLGLLAAAYQVRLRQVASHFHMRMEERIGERTRIARDLHDNLLQNVQGLILKVDAVTKHMPTEDPARQAIQDALDHADQVLAEGRDRVRELRGTVGSLGDLPAALQRVAEESTPNRAVVLKTIVEGSVRELHPLVLEESYSIGREALLNAFAHSGGLHIELEITYDSRQFRLRVRDDGRGIDPGILEKGGRDDHWGLQGMRERALRIDAQLELWSNPGTGTEIELTVPAANAYRSGRAKRKSA